MALKFPLDLSDKYYLSMNFKQYRRPSALSGQVFLQDAVNIGPIAVNLQNIGIGGFGLPVPQLGIRGGAPSVGSGIKLPIPANLQDAQSLNWTVAEANKILDSGASGDLGKLVSSITGAAASEIEKGGGPLGDLASIALQSSGLAVNPALTVLFKHPEFKTHQFSWTFSPNNEAESSTLKSIINTIKQASLPTGGGAFFGYPNIVLMRLSNQDTTYSFQPCVITNVTAHYAPTGAPSFFAKNRHPNVVTLSISFLEIILNTRGNANGSNVVDGLSGLNSTLNNAINSLTSAVRNALGF